MSEHRSFGASHGAWSKYQAISGMRVNTAGKVASKYILKTQLTTEIREELTYKVVLEIVESYGVEEEKFKYKQHTIDIKLISIIDKCEKLELNELREIRNILHTEGAMSALLLLNKGKPIINKSF